jgi:hypothetical protein
MSDHSMKQKVQTLLQKKKISALSGNRTTDTYFLGMPSIGMHTHMHKIEFTVLQSFLFSLYNPSWAFLTW